MMIEDHEDHRRIYGSILWFNGFNVFLVPDASRSLRATSFLRPDLILLDLDLPDEGGLSICRSLRDAPGGHRIPVVALSSFPAWMMRSRALAEGCLRYLEKDVAGPVDVLHAVEDVLGQPPPSGEGATSWIMSYPSARLERGWSTASLP